MVWPQNPTLPRLRRPAAPETPRSRADEGEWSGGLRRRSPCQVQLRRVACRRKLEPRLGRFQKSNGLIEVVQRDTHIDCRRSRP